jgi:hypothetical protein
LARRSASPVAKEKSAVLADHGVNGPHAGNVVAPAGGTAGDRRDDEPRFVQVLERRIGLRGETSVGGQGIVNVEEYAADPGADVLGHFSDWLHTACRF